jgi:hypothetical protein
VSSFSVDVVPKVFTLKSFASNAAFHNSSYHQPFVDEKKTPVTQFKKTTLI